MSAALVLGLALMAEIRALALGDSYTVGEGIAPSDAWPARLVSTLREEGLELELEVLAKTGWSSGELAEAVSGHAFNPPYALVTLGVGVNDQYRGLPLAEYEAHFTALLRRAIALAGNRPERVLVLSIPDWGVTPFAREKGRDPTRIAAEIDAFNELARQATAAQGARFVELTAISRRLGASALAPDRLHPSAEQHRAWLEQAILPAARQALALPPTPHSPP